MHEENLVKIERRRHSRLNGGFSAVIRTECLGEKNVVCENISQSGVFLNVTFNKLEQPEISYACLKYENIHLRIRLKDNDEFETIGVAKWSKRINSPLQKITRTYGLGIEFTNASPKLKNRIDKFITNRLQDKAESSPIIKSEEEKPPFLAEKRLYPRIDINLPVNLKFKDPKTNTYTSGSGHTINISESGICFSSETSLPNGLDSSIEISIYPTHFNNIKSYLQIIWNNAMPTENGILYGGCFSKIDDASKLFLKKIIRVQEQFIQKQINPILHMVDTLIVSKIKNKITNFLSNDALNFAKDLIKLDKKLEEREFEEQEVQRDIYNSSEDIAKKGKEVEELIKHKAIMKEIKKSFRLLAEGWVYQSLLIERALKKPRGYPGDYKMLELIYDNIPVSSKKGVGYYFDNYFLSNAYSTAVRNRKDFMKKFLADFIKKESSSSINILNLACGSCREIKELYSNFSSHKSKIKFTCVDQDDEALEFSKKSLSHLPYNAEVVFLKENILHFFSKPQYYSEKLKNFDIVYSIGLADYFPDRLLKRLIKFAFTITLPGGKFILAHKDIDKYQPVSPDWFCDWTFIPRDEEKLLSLISDTELSNYSIAIEREQSNKIFFVIITKEK